jgi:hypothetical protein
MPAAISAKGRARVPSRATGGAFAVGSLAG